MANHIAVKLDRLRVADMSCIAGVGGDVKPLVRTAKSGRPIIALDGCLLHCAAHILKRHGIRADKHYDLSQMDVSKRMHEDFDPGEAGRVLQGHSPRNRDRSAFTNPNCRARSHPHLKAPLRRAENDFEQVRPHHRITAGERKNEQAQALTQIKPPAGKAGNIRGDTMHLARFSHPKLIESEPVH